MVWDSDTGSREFIGLCESTIGKIFGCAKQTFVADLTQIKGKDSRGKIVIRLDNVNESSDEAKFKFSAKLVPKKGCLCGGVNNPFYVISRARDMNKLDEFERVNKCQNFINNINPVFNASSIKMSTLCNGNKDLPIKIELYSNNNGEELFYGGC